METQHTQRVFSTKEDWGAYRLDGVVFADGGFTMEPGRQSGSFFIKAIDSGEKDFLWERVSLEAYLPADSLIRTRAYASNSRFFDISHDLDAYIKEPLSDTAKLLEAYTLAGSSTDFYVKKIGRYLWLMFEFIASDAPPVLSKLRVHMSGDHMVDYLPAVYRKEDGFAKRYLSVFDSAFMDMEKAILEIPARFDYENTEAPLLRELAEWVCVDTEGLNEAEIIGRIETALPDFESMHTVSGVKRTVMRLTGREPLIIESHDVDPNNPGCANSALYRSLYGENPYRFFILLDEETFTTRRERERFIERMRALIPANTEFELVSLRKCVRLDRHTYLGVNSCVSSYVLGVIDESTAIHYETMIGGNQVEGF
jgi:phage tail-like protein